MSGGPVESPRPVLFTSGQLAERLKGELLGPASVEIRGLESLDAAASDMLSFVRDAKFWPAWSASRAGVTLVSRSVLPDAPPTAGRALIVVPDADAALIEVLTAVSQQKTYEPGTHPSAVVHPAAAIHRSAHIGPGVVVGAGSSVGPNSALLANAVLAEAVTIGAHTIIHPGVVIQDRCTIGDHVIIHPGVVIGSDGFGYHPDPKTRMPAKIPHIGAVVIESHVEIGANTTIDRGKFGDTRIGAGTKIDNLVQIGHNCRIGRCCLICGTCGLSGSVTLGDGVTLGGRVGITDQTTIGAGATIGGGSGVLEDIPAGETWWGFPARPVRDAMRMYSSYRKLPELASAVRKMLKSQSV